MEEQAALSFGGLLRQLRAEANLTQEDLAEAAQLSPRSISDLERGISRTARKDTALLLADALDLAGPVRELFVAAARGRGPAGDVLAAREGRAPGTGHQVALGAPVCPYRGLLPFGESDAEVFYGRERLSAELAARLAARASRGGLVVVTGASGAGKSSLLRAGLLPILARGQQVPGSDRWPRIVMTPTKDPLAELAARLAAVGGPDALAVRDALARRPDQAHLAVRSAVLAAAARRDDQTPASDDSATRLVLIVDQFEQVFTLNPDLGGETTRQAFITALCAAATTPAGPGQVPAALVAIAVRGDFCDRCAAFPELAGALQDGLFVVAPMTESELRVAITGPAQAAGLRIEPALTDTILGDLRVAGGDRSAGVLPLLSQAMALTWEHREDDQLTSRGYAQAGGVSHAVQTAADRAYDALPAGQQAIAREVLRTMTVASRGGGLARRPVTRDDLYAGLPGATRSDIDAVLDAFAAERLAVLDEDRAQLSHDVLLRAWPRLRGWLEEDQADWIVHGQLADAAAAWHDSGDDPSFLYRGAQLATLRQAVTRWSADPARSPALTGTQRGFLQASERAAARSTRWRRSALALLALLTALAGVAAGFAFSQRAAALRQRDTAISRQLAVESERLGDTNITTSVLDSIVAWGLDRSSAEARYAMRAAAASPQIATLTSGYGAVNSVAFSPDGKILATGNADGTARLWNLATGQQTRSSLHGGSQAVTSVAFSPNGKILATGDTNGTGLLWNLATGHQTRLSLGGDAHSTASVAFSPDGKKLAATGGGSGSLCQLWDVATGRQIGPHLGSCSQEAISVAFSPDGKILATGNLYGPAQLWDVATGRQVGHALGSDTQGSTSVAFSPDGKILATGDLNGPARLWNVATGRQIGHALGGSSQGTASVTFSPDGKTLATGEQGGSMQMWDLATGQQIGNSLNTHSGQVSSVAFSPDGKILATGDDSGAARLWNVAAAQQISRTVSGSSYSAVAIAFSPDGKTLATDDGNGSVRLWDMTTTRQIGPTLKVGAPPKGQSGTSGGASVAFSPDGKMLATGDDFSNLARLWNTTTGQQMGPALNTGPRDSGVTSVAFSPDGKILATARNGGSVELWDVATGHQIGKPFANSAYSVAFSPDGKILAVGDMDSTARLWDVATKHQIGSALSGGPFGGGSSWVTFVAFSPDGTTLATSHGDGSVRLWDVATGRQIGKPLNAGPVDSIFSVVFSPDGTTLATSNIDAVLLWDVATGQQIGGPLNANGTGAVAFSPDGKALVLTRNYVSGGRCY
jgi:WD40 repeat protein/transcriptional regulator with XRE-family HTH domain